MTKHIRIQAPSLPNLHRYLTNVCERVERRQAPVIFRLPETAAGDQARTDALVERAEHNLKNGLSDPAQDPAARVARLYAENIGGWSTLPELPVDQVRSDVDQPGVTQVRTASEHSLSLDEAVGPDMAERVRQARRPALQPGAPAAILAIARESLDQVERGAPEAEPMEMVEHVDGRLVQLAGVVRSLLGLVEHHVAHPPVLVDVVRDLDQAPPRSVLSRTVAAGEDGARTITESYVDVGTAAHIVVLVEALKATAGAMSDARGFLVEGANADDQAPRDDVVAGLERALGMVDVALSAEVNRQTRVMVVPPLIRSVDDLDRLEGKN